MTKNILYIGFFSLPDKDAAANRVMNNAKALREHGYNVIFIDEQTISQYESLEASLHNIDGFDVWTLKRPNGLKEYLSKMISINNVIKVINYYKKIDVIIAYNYPSIALRKLLTYCRRNSIKITSDCTEWYSGKEYSFPKNLFSAADSFYRMRIVQKKLDGVICISSYLDSYYHKTNNTVIVPPLVDVSEHIWNQTSIDLGDSINLVYCGNPGRAKDQLKPLIEAITLNNNNDFKFRVIGLTKEQYEEINGPVPNSNNVIFMGRIPHNQAINITKSSDYLVFLRDRNRVSMAGFPTKFVEAVTCGTPVITTDTSDLKRYMDAFNLGIVVENGRKIVFDKTVLQKKRASGLNYVFDYHYYTDIFENWISNI